MQYVFFRKSSSSSSSYNSIIRHSAYVHRSGSIFSCTISVFYVISATISYHNIIIITVVVYNIILYKHGEYATLFLATAPPAPSSNPCDKTAERNFGKKIHFMRAFVFVLVFHFYFVQSENFNNLNSLLDRTDTNAAAVSRVCLTIRDVTAGNWNIIPGVPRRRTVVAVAERRPMGGAAGKGGGVGHLLRLYYPPPPMPPPPFVVVYNIV